MPTPLLDITNISHAFDTPLFENVNFRLLPGESSAIVGRSGSGKSTLLHIGSTFIKPNEGDVHLLGTMPYGKDAHLVERLRRYEIGIIFQFHYLFKGMSAMENVEIATILAGEEIDPQLLEKLEITDVMHQKIGELSGGQQQRVSIARVLSKKPKVIFADEPTGNLDNETASLVMDVLIDYIRTHHAGLVLVTHDEMMAQRCDRRYKLESQSLKEDSAYRST